MSKRRSLFIVVTVGVLVAAGTIVSSVLSGTATRAYAAASAGCGKAPTLSSGTRTIQSSGQNRTYILDIPSNYDRNRPYRLIFGLHWLNGSANDVVRAPLDLTAARDRALEAGSQAALAHHRATRRRPSPHAPSG